MDNVFSLSSLIGRVRSTHSPGGPNSNMSQHQPSPRNSEVCIKEPAYRHPIKNTGLCLNLIGIKWCIKLNNLTSKRFFSVLFQNIASTLNALGLPPDSPSDSLDNNDDDPISGFLSHTPQPLPDLVSVDIKRTS